MSLSDRCRPITILWEGQRHKWRISHELFHFLHRKSLIGRHLVLWDWNFITEYEGHVFRVATYLAHYWTITWLSSRRQTVISTVLDSDCLWTALLSTTGGKSRDTNRAILLDFKWYRSCTLICSRAASQHALPINSQTKEPLGSIRSLPSKHLLNYLL